MASASVPKVKHFAAYAMRDDEGRPWIDAESVKEADGAAEALTLATDMACNSTGAVVLSGTVNGATGWIEATTTPTFIEPTFKQPSNVSRVAGWVLALGIAATYIAVLTASALVVALFFSTRWLWFRIATWSRGAR